MQYHRDRSEDDEVKSPLSTDMTLVVALQAYCLDGQLVYIPRLLRQKSELYHIIE